MSVVDGDIHALYSWIDGHDLNDMIDDFDENEQYQLGIVSGNIYELSIVLRYQTI